jgi:hypothetical protein
MVEHGVLPADGVLLTQLGAAAHDIVLIGARATYIAMIVYGCGAMSFHLGAERVAGDKARMSLPRAWPISCRCWPCVRRWVP